MKPIELTLFKRLNHLFWPILGSALAYSIMPFINTLLMGHLAPQVLAAGGLVNACFIFMMMMFWGIFTTLGTLLSRCATGDQDGKINQLFKTSFILALILGCIVAVVFWHLTWIFQCFRQPEAIIIIARPYIHITSIAMIPTLIIMVCEQFFFALGKPRVIMLNAFILLPINILLNYSLMYGAFGFPALGIQGLAWGSLTISCCNVFILMVIIHTQRPYNIHLKPGPWFYQGAAKELLTQGIPVGLIWMVEVGFFTAVAFLMGRISINALAAHEISFQAYLLAFSLAVNMGQALQIVMGECIGQKQESSIPHAYKIAIWLLSGLVFIVAMIVWCLPTLIIHLVLGGKNLANTEVAPLALCLLRIMPLFLFFDSLAFLTLSALRALKKTQMSLVIVIAIYWLLIIPSLSVGVLHLHILNPQDLWIALALGALISFILQSIYFRLQLKRLS